MSRWWRAYDDALHDPKVQALPPALFKFWFNLLCVASKYDGVIPPLEELKTALKARLDHVETHLQDLLKRGLVDEIDGRLEPHNWRKRQYKSDVSTPRVQTHRNAKRNVSETPPETDTEADTDKTSSLRSDSLPAVADDWPVDYRDRFWAAYPHKVGKPDALAKLDRARKQGVRFADLWAGLQRYVGKTDDRPWCNPATWLNQQRWTDQPALQPQRGPPRQQHQSIFEITAELKNGRDHDQRPDDEAEFEFPSIAAARAGP